MIFAFGIFAALCLQEASSATRFFGIYVGCAIGCAIGKYIAQK